MTDWQVNKNLKSCNGYMLDHQVECDVKFQVGEDTIPAHKYMLIARSPVFFAMFCGGLAQKDGSIKIDDVESAAFRKMLRFIYTDEVELNEEIVLPTLYASKKYVIPPLSKRCVDYLSNRVCVENVCTLYEQAGLFNETDLERSCADIIARKAEQVFMSGDFLRLSIDGLRRILQDDCLGAKETKVFEAAIRWGAERCQEKAQTITPQNIREALGPALFDIRFPTMNFKDYCNLVSTSGILTSEEMLKVFQFYGCDQKPQIPFPTNRRKGPTRKHKPANLPLSITWNLRSADTYWSDED